MKMYVNCATSNTPEWPWNYFWTRTTATKPPVTVGGYLSSDPSFIVEGAAPVGQTVVRGMFAYVATQAFNADIFLSASAAFTLAADNFKMNARLYKADGSLVSSFIESTESSASATISLPATTCPLILWLGASVQPTGETPTKPLPSTTATIEFTADL
jgi:hypothetical protein